MRLRIRHLIVLAVAAAVLVTSGCGGSKGQPIPSSQAAALINRLEEAKRRGDPAAFRCHDLQQDTIPTLQKQVDSLPPNTDSKIKNTLTDGIDHLNDLVSQQCNQQKAPTNTQTTNTQTTQTKTESAPTTPPSTSNTTPPSTSNTSPPSTSNTTPPPTGGGTPSPGAALPPGQQNGGGD